MQSARDQDVPVRADPTVNVALILVMLEIPLTL